jgi:hypothetical protein
MGPMKAAMTLLALSLAAAAPACSSPEKAETTDAVAEVRLPEVRYYVIADT